MVLPKHTEINTHAINLEKDKQPSYRPIQSLRMVELETLNTYMKSNHANSFIRLFKSLSNILILFNKNFDRSLRFCVNYQGLNNITIKNRYILPLIGKSVNCLGCIKPFTQLDLTSAYY